MKTNHIPDEVKDYDFDYKIIRTCSGDVFAGEIVRQEEKLVRLSNVRRLWCKVDDIYQIALEGFKNIEECKASCVISQIELLEVAEIVNCMKVASNDIKKIKVNAISDDEFLAKLKSMAGTWVSGDHAHCNKCGGNMHFLGRLSWKGFDGTRAVGVCEKCSIIIIQKEHVKAEYIKYKQGTT